MKFYLAFSLFLFGLTSIAQTDNFEAAITRGNWLVEFINFERLDTVSRAIGDTVVLSKVPKRLKFKKQRPFRFHSNGSVHSPQTPPFSCGTVSTLEAIWYLKWREYCTWRTVKNDEETLLHFNGMYLSMVEAKKKQFTFIISSKD